MTASAPDDVAADDRVRQRPRPRPRSPSASPSTQSPAGRRARRARRRARSAAAPIATTSARFCGRGLAADVVRRGPVAAEVHALDEHVRGRDDPAVRRAHDGGVVTGAEQHVPARGDSRAAIARDEPELARVANRRCRLLLVRYRHAADTACPPARASLSGRSRSDGAGLHPHPDRGRQGRRRGQGDRRHPGRDAGRGRHRALRRHRARRGAQRRRARQARRREGPGRRRASPAR